MRGDACRGVGSGSGWIWIVSAAEEVDFDHDVVEQERALVRKSFERDLVLRSEPGIERLDIGVGDNEVDVGVVPRRIEADQLPTPASDESRLKPCVLDQAQGSSRKITSGRHRAEP